METIKFQDLFEPFRGANTKRMPELTEKQIYKFSDYSNDVERIPVLSGADSNDGVFSLVPNFLDDEKLEEGERYIEKNRIRYFINEDGCLTMIRCGNAGKLNFRSKEKYPIFSLTTSIFVFFVKDYKKIKSKYPKFDGINLEWFALRFNPLFSNLVNSAGLSTIPLKLINSVDLDIPSIKTQEKQLLLYKRIINSKKKLEKIVSLIKKVKSRYLEFEIENKNDEKKLSYFLEHVSRNDELSEEGIYKRSQELRHAKEKISVLSGSFEGIYGIVPLEEKLHFVKKKQVLHVITRGDAGRIRFVRKGNYATNTNAMLLLLKGEVKKKLGINSMEDEKIYLKFLKHYLEPLFLRYVSSADLSVLPLTKVLEDVEIPEIKLSREIEEIVKDYEKLSEKYEKTSKKLNKIKNLLKKEIIFN